MEDLAGLLRSLLPGVVVILHVALSFGGVASVKRGPHVSLLLPCPLLADLVLPGELLVPSRQLSHLLFEVSEGVGVLERVLLLEFLIDFVHLLVDSLDQFNSSFVLHHAVMTGDT